MTKTDISKNEAIDKLRGLFLKTPDCKSSEKEGVFKIDPDEFSRRRAVGILCDFFSIHNLTDGECTVEDSGEDDPTVFTIQ